MCTLALAQEQFRLLRELQQTCQLKYHSAPYTLYKACVNIVKCLLPPAHFLLLLFLLRRPDNDKICQHKIPSVIQIVTHTFWSSPPTPQEKVQWWNPHVVPEP